MDHINVGIFRLAKKWPTAERPAACFAFDIIKKNHETVFNMKKKNKKRMRKKISGPCKKMGL